MTNNHYILSAFCSNNPIVKAIRVNGQIKTSYGTVSFVLRWKCPGVKSYSPVKASWSYISANTLSWHIFENFVTEMFRLKVLLFFVSGSGTKHCTSTSQNYLCSMLQPASAFIDCLVKFVWHKRNRINKKEKPVNDRKTEVLFFTTWAVSRSALGLFLIESRTQIEEWNWAKERKEKLNSVLRDIT